MQLNTIAFQTVRILAGAVLLIAGLNVQAECSSDEVGYVAAFKVKAGSEAAFEAAVSKLAAAVNKMEPGVIFYAPYRGPDGQYFMMERYKNEAARKAHGTAPEVTELFPTLSPHFDSAPVVTPVSAVCP